MPRPQDKASLKRRSEDWSFKAKIIVRETWRREEKCWRSEQHGDMNSEIGNNGLGNCMSQGGQTGKNIQAVEKQNH